MGGGGCPTFLVSNFLENSSKKVQLDDKIKPTRILAEIITIAKYIHIHLKYIPY